MTAKIIVLLATTLTGCTVTKYVSATGETFSRTSFGTKLNIGEMTVSGDTNGIRTITIHGYANDQVTVIQAAVSAGVTAGIKAFKP